jgi:hypothetical protein
MLGGSSLQSLLYQACEERLEVNVQVLREAPADHPQLVVIEVSHRLGQPSNASILSTGRTTHHRV